MDNDCVWVFSLAEVSIGFDPTSLVVNETDGSIEFTIKVLSGVLESSVIVTFSTSDGSATSSDPADFVPLSNMAVEFNAAIQSQTITVTILNDDILENSENFFGVLATPNTDNVVLDDALAEVTILEQLGDDGKPAHMSCGTFPTWCISFRGLALMD